MLSMTSVTNKACLSLALPWFGRTEPSQTQRSQNHQTRRTCHSDARSERWNVNGWVEYSSGHRQTHKVETKCPEKIHEDGAERPFAQRQEEHAILQFRSHECH